MISFGHTIRGAHSTWRASFKYIGFQKFFLDITLAILKNYTWIMAEKEAKTCLKNQK